MGYRTLIVNLEPYGRLGNRLFLAAHLMAYGLKTGTPLLNLGFGEYSKLFPWFEGNQAFAFPWQATGNGQAAERLLRRYRLADWFPWTTKFRYWGNEDWDFDRVADQTLAEAFPPNRDVLFRAWLFRGSASVKKFKAEILKVFQPYPEVLTLVKSSVAEWRQSSSILVGVHVRWEDYRGTEYFIDQSGFQERMVQVRALWPDLPVRFVLFSSDSLPTEGWDDLDCVASPAPSAIFDLTAMSHCDYLMGPPSTFSGWASFAGDVPLLVLRAAGSAPTVDQFQVVQG